jgi:cobalamin synthase
VTTRLASILLVLGAALADAGGAHEVAYYLLVVAVPVVAMGALLALGNVLDGSAAEPHNRVVATLSALVVPCVLLGTAVRAPFVSEAPPPAIGVTAVVACLALFAVQTLLTATAAVPSERLRAALRAK